MVTTTTTTPGQSAVAPHPVASQTNGMEQSQRYGTLWTPVEGIALEARPHETDRRKKAKEAARRRLAKEGISGPGVFFPSSTMNSRNDAESRESAERSTLGDAGFGPCFDVIAFEELGDNDIDARGLPVAASSDVCPNSNSHKEQASRRCLVENISGLSNDKSQTSHKSNQGGNGAVPVEATATMDTSSIIHKEQAPRRRFNNNISGLPRSEMSHVSHSSKGKSRTALKSNHGGNGVDPRSFPIEATTNMETFNSINKEQAPGRRFNKIISGPPNSELSHASKTKLQTLREHSHGSNFVDLPMAVDATANMVSINSTHEKKVPRRRTIDKVSGPPNSELSHASPARNGKAQILRKSILWPKKQKHTDKAMYDHCDGDGDDARSESSQGSETTYSSVFTSTRIKLKGYLTPSYVHKTKHKKHHQPPANNPLPEANSSRSAEVTSGPGKISPIFCRNNHSVGSSTVTTTASTIASTGDDGFNLSLQSMTLQEEEHSPRTTCIYPSVSYNSVKADAKRPPPLPPTNKSIRPTTLVSGLPWQDDASHGNLHGQYSGPVDQALRPHGQGTLVLAGNSFLKFYGEWVNGELISPLMNEDEKRDQERANNFNRYRAKPSNKHKKKPSREHGGKTTSFTSAVFDDPSVMREPKDLVPTNSSPTGISKNDPSYRRRHPKKYVLGDVARTPRDMVIHRSKNKANQCVSSLKKNDQVFLKRSNGLWTCAVIAERALQPTDGENSRWYAKHEIDQETMELEESMLFATNENGATKVLRKKHWGRFVRPMQMDDGNKQ